MRIGGTAALALALALPGCGMPDSVTDSKASVQLIVTTVNAGAVLDSDVRLGADSNLICPDNVGVSVTVRNKNPTISGSPQGDVLIRRYEVSYHRTDGRSQQGVDVPFTINGAISPVLVEIDGDVSFQFEVVRRQAKLEPPLSNIDGYDIVTMFADITLAGQTISGDSVTASGQLQIDFANYGDLETACPTN